MLLPWQILHLIKGRGKKHTSTWVMSRRELSVTGKSKDEREAASNHGYEEESGAILLEALRSSPAKMTSVPAMGWGGFRTEGEHA